MWSKTIIHKTVFCAKTSVVAMVTLVVWTTPAGGQVVDLPTTPLETVVPAPTPLPQRPQPPALQPESQPQLQPAQPAAPQPEPPTQIPADALPTDPNAPISDLTPPQQFPALPNTGFQGVRAFGATAGSFSAAPTMMGDTFGGGFSAFTGTQIVAFGQHAPGTIVSGSDGSANSTLAFEFGGDVVPNDVFTTGTGVNNAGLVGADTFNILEPIPPSDALTSPGPGFTFSNGSAVYTNNNVDTTAQPGIYSNNELWFVSYIWSRSIGFDPATGHGRPAPAPGLATRRVKIAENFSPDVRDRVFGNFSFFNDTFAGLGDISRYVLGAEKVLVDGLVSVEARLPMAGTYASTQDLDRGESRDYELGNPTLIAKGVLLRTDQYIWTGGMGVTLPLADDTKIQQGGQNILVVENESVHLLPFMGLFCRRNRDFAIQGYMQLDVAANGDPIFGNLTGGSLPKLGTFTDSTLLHLDIAANRSFYRNRRARIREAIANLELHYSGTLQASDIVSSNNVTYTGLKPNFNIVNLTAGAHLVFCNNLVVTPGISVPLRDGLDKQFDYEAIVQMNYLF